LTKLLIICADTDCYGQWSSGGGWEGWGNGELNHFNCTYNEPF